jgi:hypothetical protein
LILVKPSIQGAKGPTEIFLEYCKNCIINAASPLATNLLLGLEVTGESWSITEIASCKLSNNTENLHLKAFNVEHERSADEILYPFPLQLERMATSCLLCALRSCMLAFGWGILGCLLQWYTFCLPVKRSNGSC